MDEIDSRIERALQSADPSQAVFELAKALRDEGVSKAELYSRYDAFLNRHRADPDETAWDAIADTMDCIVGHCSPHVLLYPDAQ